MRLSPKVWVGVNRGGAGGRQACAKAQRWERRPRIWPQGRSGAGELHAHVHGCTIRSQPTVEATNPSVHPWMTAKRNTLDRFDGTSSSREKEPRTDSCFNTDGRRNRYAEFKKPGANGHVPQDPTHVKCLEQANPQR